MGHSGAWANNLPLQLSSFVGREREREHLRDELGSGRLLVLTGAGGVGKTRLALRVAVEAAESFPDGAWWVELAPLTDGVSVGGAVASALGVRPMPGATEVQAAVDRLRDERALVVLDNCEHVLDASAEVSEALLRGCPGVAVLATSRERLGVAGEVDWRVPSLSLPVFDEIELLAAIRASDACGLFVERAARVDSGFALSEENAQVIARICHELDGVPLAIELAAARVRMLSVEQIADGLRDRFRMLIGGPRGALPRQRTLRASVDWSYDLLTVEERLLFRRLGVFADGWSLEALEAVCGQDGLERWMVFDLLTSLVDKSLVAVGGRSRAARYRLLATVRQYTLELLEASGELALLRGWHLDFFAGLAEQGAGELELPRNPEWLDRLDADAANLESAVEHALVTEPERALQMSMALATWWEVTGRFAVAHTALDRALATTDPAPRTLRARALWSGGHFARYRRDPMAGTLFDQAHEMAESVGDELTLARALRSQGVVRMQKDPASARPDLRRAFELALSVNDASALMWSTTSLTWSYNWTDDFAEVERLLAEAQPAIERAGVTGVAWSALARGWCALARGECDRCAELWEAAVSVARELGDPVNEAFAQFALARLELTQGRAEAALVRLLASEAKAIAAGAAMALPLTRLEQSSARAVLGRLDEARGLLEAAIAQGGVDRWTDCQLLLVHGNVLRALGELDAARARAEAALQISEPLGMRSLTAAAHELLAMLAIARGAWGEAEALAHQALDQRVEIGAPTWMPQSLDVLALVAAGLGSFVEAGRLLGATDRARSDLGIVRWAPDGPAFAELDQALSRELGSDAHSAALAEGAGLPLDDAVAWVRRARGTRKRPSGGWDSLTPTELQVVELVTQGLNNPQIAERMFVSRATVKSHLIHIFQKLELSSRSELAAVAARRAG